MKVFISWSGELSKEIAEILRQWIPGVIQAAKPYYSPDDITKGTRWSSEIAKELDLSKIGIICLTKENLESPWIMFEAGALSKNLEKSKVCPLLFGIEPSDIKGPLVQFQAAKFSKKEMKKVIKMMNEELEGTSLSSDVLDNVFEMWWSKLDEQITKAVEKSRNGEKSDLRSERDLLEEILSLSRGLSIERRKNSRGSIHPQAIKDIIQTMEDLLNLGVFDENPDALDIFGKFRGLVDYFIDSISDDIGRSQVIELKDRLRHLSQNIELYSEIVLEKITPRIRKKRN